jgi:molybdopterin-biosynthesis enzyme MoeA-like protein
MKDDLEAYFESIANGYTLVDRRMIVDDFRRIYRQGRADQNEADVVAVKKSGVGPFDEDIAIKVIRAAGPEVGE